jgi:hypothetical protein
MPLLWRSNRLGSQEGVIMVFFKKPEETAVEVIPAEEIPEPAKNLFKTANAFMPYIEELTGMNRREITGHVLKIAVKGGNADGLIGALLGGKPAPEPKFVKYLKTGAIWVPVAIFLTGASLVGLVLFAKLLIHLMGGLT